MSGAEADSGPRRAGRRRLRLIAGWLVVAACGFYLAIHLWDSGEALRAAELKPGLLSAAAVLCLVAGQLLTGSMTYVLLRGLGGSPSWLEVLRIHLMAQVTKYLPAGGILHATAQTVTLGRVRQTGLVPAGSAVGMMFGTVCAGAACTYGIAQAAAGGGLSPLPALGIMSLPLAALLAACPVEWWPAAGFFRIRLGLQQAPARSHVGVLRQALLLTGLALAAWGCFGTAAVALAADMFSLTIPVAFLLIGAFALSWLLGFLAVVAPAGLGVREVSFMLLLQPILPPPWPVLFPIAARLAWILADAMALFIGWTACSRPAAASAARSLPTAVRSTGDDAA